MTAPLQLISAAKFNLYLSHQRDITLLCPHRVLYKQLPCKISHIILTKEGMLVVIFGGPAPSSSEAAMDSSPTSHAPSFLFLPKPLYPLHTHNDMFMGVFKDNTRKWKKHVTRKNNTGQNGCLRALASSHLSQGIRCREQCSREVTFDSTDVMPEAAPFSWRRGFFSLSDLAVVHLGLAGGMDWFLRLLLDGQQVSTQSFRAREATSRLSLAQMWIYALNSWAEFPPC